MIKIIEKCERKKLSEGRNYQMGFAFLKKVGEKEFETIVPISPCKDYLNDVVFSEATGKPLQVYGASTKKENIFDGERAYMAFKICPSHNQEAYSSNLGGVAKMTADIDNLDNNIDNITILMNYVEDQLRVENKSLFLRANDKQYLAIMDKYWVQYTYLISLYSLLIRMAQFWNGQGTPQEFLDNYDLPLDKNLWKPAIPAYQHILKNGIYKQDWTKLSPTDPYKIHNLGIIGIKQELGLK